MDFFGMIGDAFSSMFDAIGDAILTAISNFIGMILYYITAAIMRIVWLFQQFFNVFSGVQKIKFGNDYDYLINVFFNDKSINGVYWAITMIAIVLVFLFTIIAVVRKMFDQEEKSKKSLGGIISTAAKSVFIMLIMTISMNAILDLVNLGINRISFAFDNADSFSQVQEMRYTDEQFATMARIYNTIGNYSLNPSYNSKYNLNSCYNDIRADINYLEEQNVFDMMYVTKENGVTIDTWQSVLKELATVTDSRRDLKLDVYYGEVSDTLLKIMNILKTNSSFFPLEQYEEGYSTSEGAGLDRILFLSGTTSAARNGAYNEDPYLTDGLRGAFYVGEKSIYSYDEVKEVFNTGVGGISYIFIWIMAFITVKSLFKCTAIAISRIVGVITLYIVSPLTLAAMPLDDGGKFNQWMTSMTINLLGILGTVIPMRVALIFAPIIMNSNIVLFPDSVALNFIAKAVFVMGSIEAVELLSTQINGILTGTAGMASMGASERMSAKADAKFKESVESVKKVGKGVSDVTGLTSLGRKTDTLGLSTLGEDMREHGGFIGAMAARAKRNSSGDSGGSQGGVSGAAPASLGGAGGASGGKTSDGSGGSNGPAGPRTSLASAPAAGGSLENLGGTLGGETTGGGDEGMKEPPPLE